MPAKAPRRLLLLGGGHAHVEVIRRLANRPENVALTVVSSEPRTPYSGMLPGVVAGHYRDDDIHIDLAPLCARSGAELAVATATGIDAENRSVITAAGDVVGYDVLSINTGATPSVQQIDGADDFGIAVKPIGAFLPSWHSLLERIRSERLAHLRLIIVGGGAGGIELALACQHRLRRYEKIQMLSITLIEANDEILAGRHPRVRQRLTRILADRGIDVRTGTRVRAATPGHVDIEGAAGMEADEVLWVTEAGAPQWPAAAGLSSDARGFIAIDQYLRSVSHPNIFAAGDVATMLSDPRPKAGVFAVRQGPLLARNLIAATVGAPLEAFEPQREFLALISTGDRRAVATRGSLVAEGAWVWRWKDWIDRRFINRYKN